MAALTIPSIVEGHGEVKALPVLLRRLVYDAAPQLICNIPPPIRVPRASFIHRDRELERSIQLAALKAGDPQHSFILLLFDADEDCPARLAPDLLARSKGVRPDHAMALTLAKCEFEAWFAAAAESLRGKRSLPEDLGRPSAPEEIRDAKRWVKSNRADNTYSETLDQAAYCAMFDFAEARTYSPSFAKFYRDFMRLIAPFT